ncbi:hypothetical protein MASR2M78_35300 [Treponema sp.]
MLASHPPSPALYHGGSAAPRRTPLFSGAPLRLVFFVAVYASVTLFVSRYAKKIEADPTKSVCYKDDQAIRDRLSSRSSFNEPGSLAIKERFRALIWFAVCIGLAMLVVVITARMPGLSDLAFPVMALLFLVGGIGAGNIARLSGKELAQAFVKGAIDLTPGVVLILMAYSVKHVIVSGRIMDTILYGSATLIGGAQPLIAAFLVYATTLVMNFFIGSASAKAFLMMPLLAPWQIWLVLLRVQTAVLAFDFGDGFSNMVFPTNALLLIGLSFTSVSYIKWMAWTWKLQIAMLLLTSAFLAFAVAIGFGPF